MDFISIGISAFALIISFLSLVYRWKQLQLAKQTSAQAVKDAEEAKLAAQKSERIAQGNTELVLRQQIRESKRDCDNVIMRLTEYKDGDTKKDLTAHTKAFNSALERNVNTYEQACALYLDNKVDKSRFCKDFKSEIKNLVEDEALRDKFFQPHSSTYRAILKVYDEWENLEK